MRHSKDSIDRFFDYDLHLESRVIWLGSNNPDDDDTNAVMAERLIKALHILSMGPKGQDLITIKMNNFGGSFHAGLAMYDAIRSCTAPVRIEAIGACMSAATFIMQAADERIMHPNARFMIHDGQDGFEGHARNFEVWAVESQRLRNQMYRIYAERSGKPIAYWSKKCIVDLILSAEETILEGLADRVLPPVKQFSKIETKKTRKKATSDL